MNNLEKNVYFDDVKVVYIVSYTSCEGNATFLTKEDAIEYTNKFMKETSEYMTEEEMAKYHLDGDAEDYIEEIEVDPTKDTRAATDEYGNVIIERLNPYSGKWEECVY